MFHFLSPGDMLYETKIAMWRRYERDPYHKYSEGDVLILRDRRIYGFGLRPVARVKGYYRQEDGRFKYLVLMSGDADYVPVPQSKGLNGLVWKNEVPEGAGRKETLGLHFKWNIENHFKKVPKDTTFVGAIDLYGSQPVPRDKYIKQP